MSSAVPSELLALRAIRTNSLTPTQGERPSLIYAPLFLCFRHVWPRATTDIHADHQLLDASLPRPFLARVLDTPIHLYLLDLELPPLL